MKRLILPALGVLTALWAGYSVARTAPRRRSTDPPSPPPVSDFVRTVAAVGLVEANSENVAVGTPLPGVVSRVWVTVGQAVKAGDPLFTLDTRQLLADQSVSRRSLEVAKSNVRVARASLADLERMLEFVEGLSDKRAVSAEEATHRRLAVETARARLGEAQAEASRVEAQVRSVGMEIERSTVRAPIDGEVLQVKLHPGEYAPAAVTATPLVLLGGSHPLNVRVDVDENEAWRVRAGAAATAHVRGDARLTSTLHFLRFEPFVVPKKSLTGDSTERVDTRVLQVLFRIDRQDLPLFVGQQMDVFIDASAPGGA